MFPRECVEAHVSQVHRHRQEDPFSDLARQVGDPKTIKSIEILIAELEERKDALHLERRR
jgi:hypothetical protein